MKQRRHQRILEALRRQGAIDIAGLMSMLPGVSRVTLRRDLAELAENGAVKRTHGGAVLPDAEVLRHPTAQIVPAQINRVEVSDVDGVILGPVPGRGADALRRKINRNGVPFLAESAEQTGGTYLGPNNYQAGYELGIFAGKHVSRPVHALLIEHKGMKNTAARSDGFAAGMKDVLGDALRVTRVNGQGTYRHAFRVARDALRVHTDISVVFGVNDHSSAAGIEAAREEGLAVSAFGVGGESPAFLGQLADNDDLVAVAALFPGQVGRRAVDLMHSRLAGTPWQNEEITPHAIVTKDSLFDYFDCRDGTWITRDEPTDDGLRSSERVTGPGSLAFMPHYPAHDWYRIMGQAMSDRAADLGYDLRIIPPSEGISEEIANLRDEIAHAAVEQLGPNQTIIIGHGEATHAFARALVDRCNRTPDAVAGLTVITNAFCVLDALEHVSSIKVVMTAGEFQAGDRCLVGPSLGALFDRMRADVAFLSVSGVSASFGMSSEDERLALATSRLVAAARRIVVLADHTVVGVDANHRAARTEEIHELITDDGLPPADRQRFRAVGIDVTVAGDAADAITQAPRGESVPPQRA